MNEILRIIEKRELYVHIILFKVYIETEGRTDTFYGGNIRREIKELFGNEFNDSSLGIAKEFLMSENLATTSCRQLTTYGRSYIEDWAKEFETLNESEKGQLQEKLPIKIFDFFKFTEKTNNVLSFINQLIELRDKIN